MLHSKCAVLADGPVLVGLAPKARPQAPRLACFWLPALPQAPSLQRPLLPRRRWYPSPAATACCRGATHASPWQPRRPPRCGWPGRACASCCPRRTWTPPGGPSPTRWRAWPAPAWRPTCTTPPSPQTCCRGGVRGLDGGWGRGGQVQAGSAWREPASLTRPPLPHACGPSLPAAHRPCRSLPSRARRNAPLPGAQGVGARRSVQQL